MDKISDLKSVVINTLDLNKAQDIVTIDLKDKSSMADYMIIASGTSSRHIQSLSEQVLEKLKANGIKNSKIEGKESNEWKLVDGIDLIVHIFHPEKRKFYELEKIWSELIPNVNGVVLKTMGDNLDVPAIGAAYAPDGSVIATANEDALSLPHDRLHGVTLALGVVVGRNHFI